jgi:hypothetical protein
MGLLSTGAKFSGNLKQHLDDLMMEFDSETIRERIESINPALCRTDLEDFIPDDVYRTLEESDFEPLKDAVSEIFAEWL